MYDEAYQETINQLKSIEIIMQMGLNNINETLKENTERKVIFIYFYMYENAYYRLWLISVNRFKLKKNVANKVAFLSKKFFILH